jgi:hypothetical protein
VANQEAVKQSCDLGAFICAATINVATLNEWITLIAGTASAAWAIIRLVEWAKSKNWRKRRAT